MCATGLWGVLTWTLPRSPAGPCPYELHEDNLAWEGVKEDYDQQDSREHERCGVGWLQDGLPPAGWVTVVGWAGRARQQACSCGRPCTAMPFNCGAVTCSCCRRTAGMSGG